MENRARIRVTLALVLVCMAFLIPQSCQGANLLANPGFEEGYDLEYGEGGTLYPDRVPVTHGWTPVFPGSWSYSVEEKHYESGGQPYSFHTGSNAMSHSTEANGESISKQIVWVVPGETYTASVYVKGWDFTSDATGFGAEGTTDSAGMIITELDYLGRPIPGREHAELTITDPVDWTLLSEGPFQVGPNTRKIEYSLRSLIHCQYAGGRTSFDDCVLDGPAGTPVQASLTGVVRAAGSPVTGVMVTAGGQSVVTGADGVYTLTGLVPEYMGNQVSVECTGYLSENKYPSLQEGANTLDINLSTPPASNLLSNGDFEQGGPYATGIDGIVGTDKNWTYMLWGASGSYLKRESSLNKNASEPDGATFPWQPHMGNEASRHCTSAQGYLVVYQTVPVSGNAPYTASVWVKARNFDDQGFGVAGSNDYAGLRIQELQGEILVTEHPLQSITAETDWVKLSQEFTTQPETTSVVFNLETSIGGSYTEDYGHLDHGQVIYDDAVLDGPAPQADLTVTVRKEGQLLPGATVTVGEKSAVTDSNGVCTVTGIPVALTGLNQVTASHSTCWPENKFVQLYSGSNTLEFDLYALPSRQLLANPTFEDPDAPYVLRSDTGDPQYDASWVCRIWSTDGMGCLRRDSTVYQGTGTRDWETGGKGVGPGPWEPFSGTQCSRHLVESGTDAQFEISQTVWVKPSMPYKASAMAKLRDTGWEDTVTLKVQEYDVNDALQAEYIDSRTAEQVPTWTRLSQEFTTSSTTRKIKFSLCSSVSVRYTSGWANFDAAALDGEPGQAPPATLTGTVRVGGNPVEGATVACQSKSGTSGPNGVYTIELEPKAQADVATVTCPGYFEEQRSIIIVQGVNTLNYDLVTLPVHNLLANPGFEEGYPLMIGQYGSAWDVQGVVTTNNRGWTPMMHGSLSYSVEETHYKRNSPPYSFHSGADAMSHSSNGDDETGVSTSSQIVAAIPGCTYKASVWVKGWDFTGSGTGWGREGKPDTAGMQIRELDAAGNLVPNGEHTELVITDPVDWTYLSETFEASANTAKIEYILRSRMHCGYTKGRTAFDDAVLDEILETVVPTISDLKAQPDETRVRIVGKAVSASFDGFFYIEEETRASGIKVTGTAAAGIIADIVGVVRTVNGERTLVSSSITTTPGGTIPQPLGMNGRTVLSLADVGLYITAWGTVDFVAGDGSYFTMTDGGGASVKVYKPSGFAVARDDYVAVTGAFGAEMSGGAAVPVVHGVSAVKSN